MGFIGALAIHALVVAAALFTWQHPLDIAQESPPIVPVDLVTIAKKTNIAPAAPKIVPKQTLPPVQPAKPVVPQPVVAPETAEPPPEPAPSEPLVKAPSPPVVTPKARPQVPLTREKEIIRYQQCARAAEQGRAPAPSQTTATAKVAQQSRKGIGAQNAMTMDMVDALKNQIEQCWSPPAGAPHPEQLIVYVELSLNPDCRQRRKAATIDSTIECGSQRQSVHGSGPRCGDTRDLCMRALQASRRSLCRLARQHHQVRPARSGGSMTSRRGLRMTRLALVVGALAALMFSSIAPAFAALQVDVNQGNIQPLPIAIPDFVPAAPATSRPARTSPSVVRADLDRSGLFRPLDPKSFIEQITNINVAPNFANWRVITAQGLVTGQAAMQPDGRLRVDFRLWDVYGESQMLGLQYFTQPANWRRIAHMISDAIYQRITGEKGYFDTRIVFISESGPALKRARSAWRSWTRTAPIPTSSPAATIWC